jgi:hypothetical protein
MVATPEDARLLYHKWLESAARLRIRLRNGPVYFDGEGVVMQGTTDSVTLGGESWSFTVSLAGASFAFSDPREVPVASIREAETAKYEFGIAAELGDGSKLVVMELKGSDEEITERDPEKDPE